MKILFITLLDIRSVKEHNIYADLMRAICKNGHEVFILSPFDHRGDVPDNMLEDTEGAEYSNIHLQKFKIGNVQKNPNLIKKGISTVLIGKQVKRAIKEQLSEVHFDLILYSTPPITILEPIKYVKKRDNAKSYLLLKDIFPQNAVDIEMLGKTGVKGLIYKYFRKKEKALYAVCDKIGCMSPANVEYVLKHNPEVSSNKVEVCPNSIEIRETTVSPEEKLEIRQKYGIPTDKKVFIYGGNLSKPQGIPFIIDCLRTCKDKDAFFLIVGNGTEYKKLEDFVKDEQPKNVKLMKRLPQDDYDRMIQSCDIGLIFLDHRFEIPNFPSRLLSYMQARLPIVACTDPNTDIGRIISDGKFGWWCESNNPVAFSEIVSDIIKRDDFSEMTTAESDYLKKHYDVKDVCLKILKVGVN